VELCGEAGAGASNEPRPGGFRSCTEGLDPLGRLDGARRFGATGCRPLNKGGRTLLLAKWVNRGLRVFGRRSWRQSHSGGNPGGVPVERQETSDIGRIWERLPRDSTNNTPSRRGVSTHAALFGVSSEGAPSFDRSKLTRVNSPVDLQRSRPARTGDQVNRDGRRTDGGASNAEVHTLTNTGAAT
jgi:hypothetical protein